jgi:Protein of unknown function (DUF1566)
MRVFSFRGLVKVFVAVSSLVLVGVSIMLPGSAQAQAPKISPDRFQVSSDGQEVVDHETRLVWRRCLEGMRFEAGRCLGAPQSMVWSHGHDWAKQVSSAGNQWRMPTMMELTTVIDMNRHGAPVDNALFPDTPRVYVWSATVNERTPSHAWIMFYANGYMMSAQQSISYFVRLVREKT